MSYVAHVFEREPPAVPDGNTDGSAVYSLGLYGGGVQRLMPALVSEALKLGLCVLDEQAGRCYVPDAWALTEDGRRRLNFQAPPPPPADETVVPAELTPDWVCRRLLDVESRPFDAQAGAIVTCLRDEYLPLLEAYSDLPGIVRTAQDPGDLPGRLVVSRVLPALEHWAGLADVQAHAETLAERLLASPKDNRSVAMLMWRSARRMAALPELRGTWRPPTVWPALPTPADEVQGADFWALAWPRLLSLAQARGFALSEPEPGTYRLERQLPDVRQWVQFVLLKRDITSVSFALHLGTPTLHARWKTLLAPFGQGRSPRGGPFVECNLLPDCQDDFDIDRHDLGFGTDRRDFLADRVASAERALAQVIERIFDPMQALAGVAGLLQLLDPKLYKKGDAKGGDFERWACWLLLAAMHRPELVADMAALARSFFDVPRGMYGTYCKEELEAIKRLANEALRLAGYPTSPST